jgi:hypothetical protein
MALYLGSDKVKLNLGNEQLCLQLFSSTPILNGAILLSSDGYTLKDLNGLFLTTKKEDE